MIMEEKRPYLEDVQLEFAGVMEWLVRICLALLVVLFVLYVTGIVPSARPISETPELWHLSSAEFRAATGSPTGWAWIRRIGQGEYLSLAGLVIFPAATTVALCILAVLFSRRRAVIWAVMAAVQVAILVFAATGLLS